MVLPPLRCSINADFNVEKRHRMLKLKKLKTKAKPPLSTD